DAVADVEVGVLDRGRAAEARGGGDRIDVVARRHVSAAAAPGFVDGVDTVRLGDWERLEHDGVDGAEDRGGRADAERERRNRDEREPWRHQQLPAGEPGVLPELREIFSP